MSSASALNAFSGIALSIKQNGFSKTLKFLVQLGQPKVGKLVGTDGNGNEYYENRNEFHGRDRWVMFKKWNYDPSSIPPEWHQWMHRFTDDIPTQQTLPTPFFQQTHMENLTGTAGAFKTYNTVAPRIHGWTPAVKDRS